MTNKSFKKLSRRDVLKLSGTLAAGALLAGCGAPEATEAPVEKPTEAPVEPAQPAATEAPVAKPVEGHVVVMHFLHEFTEDHVNAFQEANPGITV